ncbi:MAG: GDSL-type esterase/lipase family protein [Anaerobutyricum soehngenii]
MTTILCYGDSNTYGYNPVNGLRYPKDVRWTGVLQKMLGEEYEVIEEGCNGRTTVFEGNAKEPWKAGLGYLRPCLNTHKPIDFVIMMLGSNDLKRMFHASAQEIADGAEELVKVIKEFTKEKQGYHAESNSGVPAGDWGRYCELQSLHGHLMRMQLIRSKELSVFYERIAKKYGCISLMRQR